MSSNNQPLNGTINPLQRVSLNSLITNLVLDADSGNSSLLVQTGSTTSLYIDKFANVGLNTSSPTAQFEVVSNNGACMRLRYGSSSTAYANIFMTSSGNLSIGSNAAGSEVVCSSSLNLTSHNGTSSGLKLNGSLVTASATQLNYNVVVAGIASASKALVLDNSSNITGINSLSASSINGTIQTSAQPNITSLGTLTSLNISGNLNVSGSLTIGGGGSISDSLSYVNGVTVGIATASKALVVDSNKDIIGIRSLGVTNIIAGSSTINTTELTYLSGVTAGTATSSKVLVLNSSGSVSGINSISATNLTGTMQTAAQPNITSLGSLVSLNVGGSVVNSTEIGYLSGVTAGSASNNRAIVLNSSGSVSGVNSFSASTLTGIIQSNAQPNITSLGTLTSLNVSGSVVVASTSNATSATSGGAVTISGGLGVAKNVFIGSDLTITGNLIVNGTSTTVNSSSIAIQDNTIQLNASPSGVTDSGIIINRYQPVNDSGNGSIIADSAAFTTTIQSSTSNSVTLQSGSAIDNFYQNWWIKVGTQARKVASYVASTKQVNLESNFTTQPLTGATISFYNKVYASFVWNEASSCFTTGFTTSDSTSTFTFIDNTDLKVANMTTTKTLTIQDTTESTSSSSGSIVTSGGVGIAKSLRVSGGMYGTIQTAAQPNITSLGTLTSLNVSGTVTSSLFNGTIQTAAQPNITSLGTLTSLSIDSTSSNMLSLNNTSSSGTTNLRLTSDSYTAEVGIRGTTASVNASTFYVYYNGSYRLLMNTAGDVAIGTSTFGYKLNVSGSVNATSISVNGTSLSTSLISGSITAGAASASKVLSVDANRDVANINSLTATSLNGTIQTADQPNITSLGALTSLTVGSSTISGSDLSLISSITAGTVSAGKALVANSNKDISGIRFMNLTNTTASSYVSQTFTSDTQQLEIGVRGSTNSTNPNMAYLHFNSAYRLLIDTSGQVAIGTNTFGYRLNVGGTINSSDYYLNGSKLDFTSFASLSGVTTGSASANKVLIVDGSKNISGINNVSSSSFTIDGNTLTGTQAYYLTGITVGTASASKALVLDSSSNISGINTLSVTSLVINGVDVSSAITSSEVISNVTAGTASASKAVILDSNKSVSGVNTIGLSTLSLGGNSITSTEASYLTGITAGTVSNSKAMVVNSSGSINGLNTLGVTTLNVNGTTISSTEVGYLTSITSGTASNSKALVLNSSGSISGINTIGVTSVNVNGTSFTSTEAAYLSNVTEGTASNGKALIINSSGSISGINTLGASKLSVGISDSNTQNVITAGLSTLADGSNVNILLGKATSTYNSAMISYKHVTSGSLSNAISFGMNGVADILNCYGNGRVSVNKTSASYTLDVNGSINATEFRLNGNVLELTSPYLQSITAGVASNERALVIDSSGSITGINSFGVTSIVVGGTTLTSTQANFLTSITAGTASASKAIVLDENKDVTGIRVMALSGTNDLLSLTNTSSSGYVAQTYSSNVYSLAIGVRGSTNATNPNTAYLHYNGAYRLLINSSGEVSIGTSTFGYGLNVNGTINSTGFSLNGSAVSFSSIVGVTAGVASASKALIVDSSTNISGIGNIGSTGILTISNTTASTSNSSGSAIFSGGIGVAKNIITGSSVSSAAWDVNGIQYQSLAATYTNNSTSSSGTVTSAVITSYARPTIAAANTGVTCTNAATVYIANAPLAGSNMTLTNSYSLWIPSGKVLIGDASASTSATTGSLVLGGGLGISGTVNIGGNLIAPSWTTNGIRFASIGATYTNSTTASSSVAASAVINSFGVPTISAINSSVTTTNAATVYIGGAPAAGSNMSLINSYSLWIPSGKVLIGDTTASTSSTTGSLVISGGLGVSNNINVGGTVTASTLILGSTSLTSTQAAYLTSITAGTATASKALVLDASRNITNINAINMYTDTIVPFECNRNNSQIIQLQINPSGYTYFGPTTATDFSIQTSNAGRIYIKSDGKVGIGGSSPSVPFHVFTSVDYTFSNAWGYTSVGQASGQSSSTASASAIFSNSVFASIFFATSDRRLKTDITNLDYEQCKQFVFNTSPVRYKYKNNLSCFHYGYIAQDVYKAGFTDLISVVPQDDLEETIDEDGFKSAANEKMVLSYEGIIPILATNIKNIYEENEQLKAKVQSLEERLAKLEMMMNK